VKAAALLDTLSQMPEDTPSDDGGQVDPLGETTAVFLIGQGLLLDSRVMDLPMAYGVCVAAEQLSETFHNSSTATQTPTTLSLLSLLMLLLVWGEWPPA
jgi:hypothetical protein